MVKTKTALKDRQSSARHLSRDIETLANRGRCYRPDEWLYFLCQDVLAGFGRRLQQPWDEERQEALYALSSLYGNLVGEHPWKDILGPTYMELGSSGQQRWLGQYFTPQTVASCMAEMQLADAELDAHLHSKTRIRVMEPACGSGVMLLAACDGVQRHHGVSALQQFALTAIDLDCLCAEMTATQLLANATLHGALGEVHVYQGNALTHADMHVIVSLAWPPMDEGGLLENLTVPSCPMPIGVNAIPAASAIRVGEQLSLF